MAFEPKRTALAMGYRLCTKTLTRSKAMILNYERAFVSMLSWSMRLSSWRVISLLQMAFRAYLNCSLSFLHLRRLLLLR